MRDIRLRCSIDRGPWPRSHVSLVFCECLQVILLKGATDLAYEISPMYRESLHGITSPRAKRLRTIIVPRLSRPTRGKTLLARAIPPTLSSGFLAALSYACMVVYRPA